MRKRVVELNESYLKGKGISLKMVQNYSKLEISYKKILTIIPEEFFEESQDIETVREEDTDKKYSEFDSKIKFSEKDDVKVWNLFLVCFQPNPNNNQRGSDLLSVRYRIESDWEEESDPPVLECSFYNQF